MGIDTTQRASAVIRASAGTGKTQRLTTRYLQLLHRGEDPQRILAVTFTRKAAGEIFDRVIARLVQGCQHCASVHQLAMESGQGRFDRARCLELLVQLTRQMNRLQVGTLDAYFFQSIGQPTSGGPAFATWTLAEETSLRRLHDEAIQRLLSDDEASIRQLVHWLAKGDAQRGVAQLLSVTVEKAYALYRESRHVGRSAWMVPQFAGRLDATSFTEALQQMRHVSSKDRRIDTARQTVVGMLQSEKWDAFLEHSFVRRVEEGENYYGKPIAADFGCALQPLIVHARACLVAQVADYTMAAYDLLEHYHKLYTVIKRQVRFLTFDDLPELLVDTSLARPDHDARSSDLWDDPKIHHLLLDEFQDTSMTQWRALRAMARRTAAAHSINSFLCVGDPKQSIYGWRGGVPELLESLPQLLPDIDMESIVVSHRSSPVVIDVVNRVFTGLPSRIAGHPYEAAVRQWCERYEPHSTSRTQMEGHATLRVAPDRDATIGVIGRLVEQLHRDKIDASIAVLVLTNEQVADVMHDLRQRGIPASEEGGQPLTDSAAVRVILSALKLAEHPGDTVARFHLKHSPLADTIQLLEDRSSDSDPTDDISRHIRHRIFYRGLGDCIEDWARQLRPSCSVVEWRRVQQLIEQAYEWDRRGWTTPTALTQFIATERVGAAAATRVRVMTVHQAKGLQFDCVIFGENDKRLIESPSFAYMRAPDTREVQHVICYKNQRLWHVLPRRSQQAHAETVGRMIHERLCVLYVALTRAVHALHIVVPAWCGTGRQPSSLGGLLRAALADNQATASDDVLFEIGDADWQLPARTAQQDEDIEPLRQPVALLDASEIGSRWTSRPSQPVDFWTPSRHQGNSTVPVARCFETCRTAALRAGTLVHRVLEQITWWNPKEVLDQQIERAIRSSGIDRTQHRQQLTELIAWLKDGALQSLLDRHSYLQSLPMTIRQGVRGGLLQLEVRNEASVVARLDIGAADAVRPEMEARRVGHQWFTGTVDRLVLAQRERHPVWAHVIDYKTDRLDLLESAEERAQRVDAYRPQMSAYRAMVADLLGITTKEVRTDLCFVTHDRLLHVA